MTLLLTLVLGPCVEVLGLALEGALAQAAALGLLQWLGGCVVGRCGLGRLAFPAALGVARLLALLVG